MVGPHIGAIAGVLTYQLFVGLYNETDDENDNTYGKTSQGHQKFVVLIFLPCLF